MSENKKPDAVDKLVEAYEHMLKRIHETIEQAEKETIPAFRELLHKTRDNMVELGELTREEHLLHRGGGGALQASRHRHRRGRGTARREMGRDAPGQKCQLPPGSLGVW